MECMICHQRIESGERILWASPVVFHGPEDGDVSYIESPDDFQPAIHQRCLGKPTATTGGPNRVVSEPVEETSEAIVERSSALAMFDL